MRIALIGNSHLACVRAAWQSETHDAMFVGGTNGLGGLLPAWTRRDAPPALALDDDAHPTQRRLWRACRGDESPLRLEHIDAIVFVGVMAGARPWHLSNCPLDGDLDWLTQRGHPPISFAQWRMMYGGVYGADVQRQLVDWTDIGATRPVLSLTRPRPRADAADFDPQYAMPDAWSALSVAHRAALVSNERALVTRLGEELGVRVVHPPRSTLIDGNLCPVRYSIGALGSQNFVGGEPQYGDDPRQHPLNISHKNAAYGAILVEQIHRCLDGRSPEVDPEEL